MKLKFEIIDGTLGKREKDKDNKLLMVWGDNGGYVIGEVNGLGEMWFYNKEIDTKNLKKGGK